mmetsp:Transcript_15330/g.17522  ORF Transcript_15330/g.17522 Transcript_15330/m.17522 type:complete len:479 (+) Transcript_15330:195-1631(+)
MSNQHGLTSTTAPGKLFESRADLASHYKSDWHKYNLKRREANMTMLTHEEFTARLEAAMALRREREGRQERSGKDHLKDKTEASLKKSSEKKNNGRKISKRQIRKQERNGFISSEADQNTEEKEEQDVMDMDESDDKVDTEEEQPVIDPKQSLFDKHVSVDVKANVDYMYKKYGFFIPDIEFLVDMEGLVGYCAEKIKLGHTCLYCQKIFRTWRGCQEHMINTSHTKLKYEKGIDLDEFDVFYDFTSDDVEFLNSGIGNHKNSKKKGADYNNLDSKTGAMEISDDDSGEWEDIDSDEEMNETEEDDGLYAAYQDEIAQHGFDITPLGELIFPDGRIIGHRGLARYYKQRISTEDSRAAVVAARRANGERIYEGRVYDINTNRDDENNQGALHLARVGLSADAIQGRQGRGILVPVGGSTSAASYTTLSLYRYKASVKKARKEEFKGRRLQQRTNLPMNKMDKKWNRLANNVSVAHAPR